MRLPTAFSPLAAGDIDNFGFDYSAEIGEATIVSVSWSCTLAPFGTAIDPAPQSRVLRTSIATVLDVRSPIDGSLHARNGFFSVAMIGGMPGSAIGGTYFLESTATLSDGRVLSLASTVLCTAQ